MATRSFILDRSGDEPAILPANEDNKVRVFHTIEEAERNIENLAEGEIVATDNDTEDSSTIPPNILKYIAEREEAMKQYDADQVDLGPFVSLSYNSGNTQIAPYDGYIYVHKLTGGNTESWLYINGVEVWSIYINDELGRNGASFPIKKGDTYSFGHSSANLYMRARWYRKRDYSNR